MLGLGFACAVALRVAPSEVTSKNLSVSLPVCAALRRFSQKCVASKGAMSARNRTFLEFNSTHLSAKTHHYFWKRKGCLNCSCSNDDSRQLHDSLSSSVST